jgi:hypothetical protein
MEPAEILDLINAALNLDFQLDPALDECSFERGSGRTTE